jgi:hypothetical protein
LKPVISAVANDITVVDTSNYLPVSGQPEQYGASPVEAIDAGQPEAAWLQEQWGRPVIRAWNAHFAYTLADMGKARGEPGRLALPVAGDSADSKQLVMRLVDDTGFDAVDAGTIAESWRQQMGTPAWCTELTADQLREALGLADREAAPKRRDATRQIIGTWQDPSNFQDWLRLYRAAARFPAADDRAPMPCMTWAPRSVLWLRVAKMVVTQVTRLVRTNLIKVRFQAARGAGRRASSRAGTAEAHSGRMLAARISGAIRRAASDGPHRGRGMGQAVLRLDQRQIQFFGGRRRSRAWRRPA